MQAARIAIWPTLAAATSLSAQATGSITGRVIDRETGTALVGAQVFVPGSPHGVLTGEQGRFLLLNVPAGELSLRAELIGYASGERTVAVPAGETAVADFHLRSQAVALEELVVTGYGTQRREDLTGAVASVNVREFIQAPALDAASLVKGKIAGLVVNNPTGDPADGTEISLRGMGTIMASTDPLVIVDGVPGDLETVAPQDIESIDVLKDASAGAIYGSRAANGVIFISTKKHRGGGATIRYDGYSSVQTLRKSPDLLTSGDVRRLAAEGFTTPAGLTFDDLGYGTDWIAEIMRDRPVAHSHNITLMGGEEETSYTASFSYESTEGVLKKSANTEVTGRVNINHSMYDRRLAATLNLVSRWELQPTGPDYGSIWRQALIRNPTDRVYEADGDWQVRGAAFYQNPVQLLHTRGGDQEARNLRLHGTLSFRPINELTVSLLTGTERGQFLRGWYRTLDNPSQPGINGAGRSTNSDESRILELTGTYSNIFGDHQIRVLGGYEYFDRLNESFDAENADIPSDLFGYSRLQAGAGLQKGWAGMDSGKLSFKTIGFFGRMNWDWNNRFLATAHLRYEGDSRFGAGRKWGLFPGISVGWRLSEEGFMAPLGFVDDLKVRVGFGVTGIAPSSPYLSLTTYFYDPEASFPVGGSWVQGLSPERNPNPELKWERKEEWNIGMDFSSFDYRLAGSLDLYRRDTRDMLINYTVPVPPFLHDRMLANVGQMRNEGIEASITLDAVRRADFRWRTSATWSTNRNTLVSLSNEVYVADECYMLYGLYSPVGNPTSHRTCVGGEGGNFYAYHAVDISSDGKWIVSDSLGKNPMPYGDAGFDDRMVVGNGVPDHYLAWNNSIRWRALDLQVNMRGAFGHQILNQGRMDFENLNDPQRNTLRSAFDPVFGKAVLDDAIIFVDYYVEDGDYWKVDNATVGYTFDSTSLPGPVARAVQSARIYAAGRNLLTLTGYSGLDPEVPVTGFIPGIEDLHRYPTTRTFTLGMNLVF